MTYGRGSWDCVAKGLVFIDATTLLLELVLARVFRPAQVSDHVR